jgi:Protein of unknown function (DUF3261)
MLLLQQSFPKSDKSCEKYLIEFLGPAVSWLGIPRVGYIQVAMFKKEVMQRLAASGLLALSAFISAGCTEPRFQPGRLALKLPPAALGESVSLQQHLIVEWNGRIDELDAVLEIDPQRLNLIGLVLGQRVFTLHYDGETLQSWRHPMFPSRLRDEDILEDIQLTLWPVEAIQRTLPTDWRIREDGLQRTLFVDGNPVMVVDYSGQPRWSGKIKLSNLRYHYRLMIESVPNDP